MKNGSIRNAVMDFDIGGMGEARLKGIRFGKYDIAIRGDDRILVPDFLKPELIQPIDPYYKVTGQELLLRVLRLYKSIDFDSIDNATITIREWCQNNIHPFSDPELIILQPEFTWDMHWINLWNSGSGMFSVRKFMNECKHFFDMTGMVLTLTLIQGGREKEADTLYHQYFYEGGFDLYQEYMQNEHYSKEFLSADNYAMLPSMRMKVEFDPERMQPVFLPEVDSIFDVLYYTLIRIAAANAPALDENWRRQSIAICESCGELFIKDGNRQKYCKDPLCQAERNNRKAQAYYLRKKQNASASNSY